MRVESRRMGEVEPALRPEEETDLLGLAAALTAIPSVSRAEAAICDWIEARLRARGRDLALDRWGNSLVARTDRGLGSRVVFCGHLDTVPGPAGALLEDGTLTGLGAVDMKGGLAVMLQLAESGEARRFDCTYVFYECEEVGSEQSGLMSLLVRRPELVKGDFAVVMEPTDNWLEAGCQGLAVYEAVFNGRRAHSARPWLGVNAVARAIPALSRLTAHEAATVEVDGLEFRESLTVVGVQAGVATNVVPDECAVQVNRRYAPSRTQEAVTAEVRALAEGADRFRVVRSSPAGRPWLDDPLVSAFQRELGLSVRPKLGTTDVGRLSQVGIPAVNFGPGSPEMAHTPLEILTRAALERCHDLLASFLRTR
jgi:succinyl-diaminopimelate desuccinylase